MPTRTPIQLWLHWTDFAQTFNINLANLPYVSVNRCSLSLSSYLTTPESAHCPSFDPTLDIFGWILAILAMYVCMYVLYRNVNVCYSVFTISYSTTVMTSPTHDPVITLTLWHGFSSNIKHLSVMLPNITRPFATGHIVTLIFVTFTFELWPWISVSSWFRHGQPAYEVPSA